MATVAPDRFTAIQSAVEAAFRVNGVEVQDGRLVFDIVPSAGDKERFLRLREDLEPLGVLPLMRQRQGRTVILLSPKPPRTRPQWAMPVALFVATLASTFFAGYFNGSGGGPGRLSPVQSGLSFSLPLMAILFCHEMGHKLVSIWRGIDAGLPLFIPMAPPFGTMGAVILMRTQAPNRDALADLGASGPIAGFLVAVPVLIYGIGHSTVIANPAALAHGCQFASPRLVDFLITRLLHPDPSADVLFHPAAFAGWFGLLVTAINLLPGSMLDGGHVTRALFGARVHLVMTVAAAGVAFLFKYWLMGVLILLLLRRGHPGPLDDVSPVSVSRQIVALVLVVIFALSVVPFGFSCQ